MNAGNESLTEGLDELNRRLGRDLELLCYPPADWVEPVDGPDGKPMLDAVIVGAGMCGLSAAFALKRHGIGRIAVLDRAQAGEEGPWVTYARMETLRSPKHLTGPAAGIPNLTFRAWYEAQWGASAWERLGKIPRAMWMDYLCWFRDVLALPVSNGVDVLRVEPLQRHSHNAGYEVTIDRGKGSEAIYARRVVIASGREGLASPRVPAAFAPHMGGRCWHSSDPVDFAALEGKTLAVIGWAASAVDNAATALEAGVNAVHVIARADAVPRINKAKSIVYSGFTDGFPALPDERKLEIMRYIASCGVAAPRDSVLRLQALPGFQLHLGRETQSVEALEGGLRLHFRDGSLDVDGVILGTGFRIDVLGCSFIRHFAEEIACWGGRMEAEQAAEAGEFADFPYLGDAFQLTEKSPGAAPYLRGLYCFTHAASLTHGNVSGDIPSVSDGAARLARGMAADFFVSEAPVYRQRLETYLEPELLGDELNDPATAWWPALD